MKIRQMRFFINSIVLIAFFITTCFANIGIVSAGSPGGGIPVEISGILALAGDDGDESVSEYVYAVDLVYSFEVNKENFAEGDRDTGRAYGGSASLKVPVNRGWTGIGELASKPLPFFANSIIRFAVYVPSDANLDLSVWVKCGPSWAATELKRALNEELLKDVLR